MLNTPAVEIKKLYNKLQVYANSFAGVLYHLAIRVIEVQWFGVIARDEYHIETTVLQHAIELAFAGTERDRARGIIVGDIDGGILTLFVVIVGTLVLIELELTILTGIDIELQKTPKIAFSRGENIVFNRRK
jgi:hypothetical protein